MKKKTEAKFKDEISNREKIIAVCVHVIFELNEKSLRARLFPPIIDCFGRKSENNRETHQIRHKTQ